MLYKNCLSFTFTNLKTNEIKTLINRNNYVPYLMKFLKMYSKLLCFRNYYSLEYF